MSSTASDVRNRGQGRIGLLGKLFSFASNLLVILLLAVITSIFIEWVGMSLWWKDEGVNHSKRMVDTELSYIGADLRESLYGPVPVDIANHYSSRVGDYLGTESSINKYVDKLSRNRGLTRVGGFMRASGETIINYYESAVNIIKVFVMRLVVIVFSAPLFILLIFAASIDGLVQRELRKAGGGREYGFVYHQLKSWFKWLFFLPLFIYLASPFATHPTYIIVPGAVGVATLCFFISSTFKKYL